LKGKPHAFESWPGYLSFFDTAPLYTGCKLSASQKAFQNFGMIQPASQLAMKK
jgi:hypothetical protein